MTTVFVKSDKKSENKKGIEFLKKCGANMCTTCFKMDFVPRMYGNVDFFIDLTNDVLDEIEEKQWLPLRLFVGFLINRVKTFRTDTVEPYVPVALRFQHIGNVLYYKDFDAYPKVYVDDRDGLSLRAADGNGQFRDIKYEGMKNGAKEAAYYNHLYIVYGPGLTLKFEDWMEGHISLSLS